LREIIEDSIEWQVNGTIVDELEGDEYYEACAHVINLAINKLIQK
jgi:beta-glucanase (GH16 family)